MKYNLDVLIYDQSLQNVEKSNKSSEVVWGYKGSLKEQNSDWELRICSIWYGFVQLRVLFVILVGYSSDRKRFVMYSHQ